MSACMQQDIEELQNRNKTTAKRHQLCNKTGIIATLALIASHVLHL